MKLELREKPKNPVIIEGFPGFGLIGTITTEFLIEQLKAKQIGTVQVDEVPAMVAIHDGNVVNPIGVFYDKNTNIVIVHVVTSVQGIEWELTEVIAQLARELEAKEVISLEGVASGQPTEKSDCFYYASTEENRKRFDATGLEQLKEGIIIGVTGALLLEKGFPISCIFVETHSTMPDSKASAEVIKVIDRYMDLKIDPQPLMEQAEKFEEKIKGIMENTQVTADEQKKKRLSYVG